MMAKAHSNGLMVLSMLVIGSITKHMVKVHFIMLMAMFTQANGPTTKPTEKVFTLTIMEHVIKAIGMRTCSMASALRLGQTIQNTLAFMSLVPNMDSVFISGQIIRATEVNGKKIKLMGLVGMIGLMKELTPVNGSKIIWRASAYTIGLMVAFTKDSTLMTRNMGLAFIRGPMDANMRVIGPRGNSTGLEPTLFPKMVNLSLDCGRTAKGSSGLVTSRSPKSIIEKLTTANSFRKLNRPAYVTPTPFFKDLNTSKRTYTK